MKILNAREIKDADAFTIKNEPITSTDLMERASQAFVGLFTERFPGHQPIYVICGTGNNGGDGLAISRLLLKTGYPVETYIIKANQESTPDFKLNLERLKKLTGVKEIEEAEELKSFSKDGIIIDALFGSGLSRPLSGIFASVVDILNNTGLIIVSVDIASGLPADQPAEGTHIIKPSYTISFQIPKMAFLIPENEIYTGKWDLVNIGLNQDFIDQVDTPDNIITPGLVKSFFKTRTRFSHKGNFGKVMIISGSFGKMGAAVLCAKACMRSGVGLLTMHIPSCGYEIMQISVQEAMASVDSQKNHISGYPDLSGFDAIGIGPGIGMHENTVNMIGKILENTFSPIVLDADALNIIARNNYLLENLPPGTIITPHVREFERITGDCKNHYERIAKQRDLSMHLHIIVILKGACTSISLPDGRIYFNLTGNPGMATAGSGDVLTGIITGFLGQKYTPEQSAIMAVYLHGLSGDLGVISRGIEGLIASDLVEFLGKAIQNTKK